LFETTQVLQVSATYADICGISFMLTYSSKHAMQNNADGNITDTMSMALLYITY